MIKTDALGNMEWNKTYGGEGSDHVNELIQTIDGGFSLAGSTSSFGVGDADMWLLKTDAQGDKLWNKTYGGEGTDLASKIVQTPDGGFALVGSTQSFDVGDAVMWLVKTDALGNMEWNKAYGGEMHNWVGALVQTTDDGFALAGHNSQSGGGNFDMWFIKTDAQGNMQWNKAYGGEDFDSARGIVQTTDGGFVLAGSTYSFGAGENDMWLVKTNSRGYSDIDHTDSCYNNSPINAEIRKFFLILPIVGIIIFLLFRIRKKRTLLEKSPILYPSDEQKTKNN